MADWPNVCRRSTWSLLTLLRDGARARDSRERVPLKYLQHHCPAFPSLFRTVDLTFTAGRNPSGGLRNAPKSAAEKPNAQGGFEMLSVLTCAALTFIALTPPAAVTPVRGSASCMLFGTLTGSRKQLLDEHEAEYADEHDATPVFGRVRSALDRLYPRRVVSSVLTRIGLRRWLKSAALTDAMLTAELHGAKLRAPAKAAIRDLAEVNWETTLLPPIPPPATGRSLSEVSWEDHCLPPVGVAAVQGRLSELSWEDRLLPTLVPAKPRQSELAELSWEDRVLPPLSTAGTTAKVQGRLSEVAWEDHLLPTLGPAKLQQHVEFGEDDWRAGGG